MNELMAFNSDPHERDDTKDEQAFSTHHFMGDENITLTR